MAEPYVAVSVFVKHFDGRQLQERNVNVMVFGAGDEQRELLRAMHRIADNVVELREAADTIEPVRSVA